MRSRLILYGGLLTPDGGNLIGVALALQISGREALDALLRDARLGLEAFPDAEVHHWEFGGRR
jgi:hypothetical protein